MGNNVKNQRKWCVYIHTNKTNGKKYIGQTGRKPEERWGNNGCGYNNKTPHFSNAISKWGWDNFNHEIIADNLTKEEADELEIELIALHNTCDRDYGYNHSKGGTGGNNKPVHPVKKYDLDGNFIKYYNSAAEAGVDNNCDRSRITHCCKLKTSYKGFMYRYADEIVDGKYIRKNRKPILQYDLDGNFIQEFESCADAARTVNGKTTTVSKATYRTVKHYAYGYLWFDATVPKDELEILVPQIVKLPMQQPQKTVYQYDLNYNLLNKFPSITNASNKTNINHGAIYDNCYNFIKSTHGYIFSFEKYESNI